MDTTSESRLALVHPILSKRIHDLQDMLSFPILVTQGMRTYAQQDIYWQQGRNPDGSYIDPVHHVGVITNAKGGQSMHNFGLAVDVAPIGPDGKIDWEGSSRSDRWKELLAKAPSCSLAEGAQWRTFPDEPHLYPVECPANPDDNMRIIMAEKGLQAVWDEVLPSESMTSSG